MNKKTGFGVLTAIILLGGIFTFQYLKFYDGKLHVVFCDVGQGDGIFIRTPAGKNFLVDAGPNEQITACVEKNTPFWDKKISFAILTHPHADHFTGFMSILDRYRVENFAVENIDNDSQGYENLQKTIEGSGIKAQILSSGDQIRTEDGLRIRILGPTEEFINQVSPEHLINRSSEQATLILLVSFREFDVLLTGDTEKGQFLDNIRVHGVTNAEVMKVSHHGSKSGLTQEILNILNPQAAVISVGKNSYGHPSPLILDLLNTARIKTFRTDTHGDIEFVSDGYSWGKID